MILSEVTAPWWDVCFVVGGGPSLKGYDLSPLRRRGTILGINRSAFEVGADAMFSLDLRFIRERRDEIAAFPGEVYLAVPYNYEDDPIPGARYIERRQGRGISTDPSYVVNGLNSGYGGLNLALLKRSRVSYLLGFDLVPTPAGTTHWHGGYPWQNHSSARYYPRWADRFEEIARELPKRTTVYNCNPDSAVHAFPILPYEELGLRRGEFV